MKRVKDENDWLRDELEETEKKLHEALGKITYLEEEKKNNDFLSEVKSFDFALFQLIFQGIFMKFHCPSFYMHACFLF